MTRIYTVAAVTLALTLLVTAAADSADRTPNRSGFVATSAESAPFAGAAPGASDNLTPDGTAAALRGAPTGVPFQGFLTDAGGNPLGVPSPVAVTVDFRFYDAAAAGTLLHSEAHVVTVSEGVFHATLSPPANLFHALPRFLGLAVDGGSELTPRTEVLSTPFARVAGTLAGFGSVNAELQEGGGVTEIVAGTTNQTLRRFYLESAGASSWSGRDGRLILAANGQSTGGSGVLTVTRAAVTIATIPVPASGNRAWTYVVDLPALVATENIDVLARADAAAAPLLVRGITFETTTGAGGATDGDWTIVGNNMNSAVSGNVGIGVPAASTAAKLDVAAGTGKGLSVTNTGTLANVALFARNTGGGTSVEIESPNNNYTGWFVTPTALAVYAGNSDQGAFFLGQDNHAIIAHVTGSGTALVARDVGGAGKAGEFQGDVEMSNDLTVSGTVLTDALTAASGALAMTGNITSTNGDFYAAELNGVINCGGGVMNPNANVISDTTPTITYALGDEDLFIQDDLEVLGQGYKPGGGSWATVSDARVKKDVRDFKDGLDAVLRIRPVWYRYNENPGFADGREYVGILAQEMQEVAPYMVEEKPVGQVVREDAQGNEIIVDPGKNYLSYDSSALVYLLVNAVQEQQKTITQQQGRIEELERRIGGR